RGDTARNIVAPTKRGRQRLTEEYLSEVVAELHLVGEWQGIVLGETSSRAAFSVSVTSGCLIAAPHSRPVGIWFAPHHVRPNNSFAAAATGSGSNANLRCSSLSGAEAPNVFMPMMRPDWPT